jgi:predicted Zn-dependent protease
MTSLPQRAKESPVKSTTSTVIGVIVALLVSYGGIQLIASSKPLCQITFIPIGNFPSEPLQTLANYYEETLGLHIAVQPIIPFEDSMIDRARGQLIGEEIIKQMKIAFPEQTQNRTVMMMGFTRGDMYIRQKEWRFAFAIREDGRFAAISTARMDPESFGFRPNDAVLVRRLLKMTSKQIGLYFYGLPERQEKSSVLFSPILGVDDLDEVSMDFDAIDRGRIGQTARRCNPS